MNTNYSTANAQYSWNEQLNANEVKERVNDGVHTQLELYDDEKEERDGKISGYTYMNR